MGIDRDIRERERASAPVGGGSSPRPPSPTGFGGPAVGEDTTQRHVWGESDVFWRDVDGAGFSIYDVNAMLAELGFGWTVPPDLQPGSLDYDRMIRLIDDIVRRAEEGRGGPVWTPPYTDFGDYGDEIYAHAEYGLAMGELYASGSGRGRRGSAGPVYVAPDPEAIEEYVKTYVVATTGTLHQNVIDGAVKAFIDATRRDFDNPEQEIDPTMAMKDFVRNSGEYKHVQELRPESVDELEWVTSRQAQLRQLGLNAEMAERVGVNVAAVGAATPDVQAAGERAQVGATGRMLQTQRNRIKNRAVTALRIL